MAFAVSYVYKLNDKYSAPLKKIRLETAAFNKQITGLETNLNRTSTSLRKMAKGASRSQSKFRSLGGAIGGAGKKLRAFGTSANVMATSLISGLAIRKFTQDAIALESAMTDVTKVFGDAGALAPFQNQMSKVGATIGQSREEMNKLAFQAGKLGIPLEEVAKFAELTGKVAVAFDTDLGQATTFLADMRTKMGLNNVELKTTLDIVNSLADNTSASGQDILIVTQRLAGTFKSLKVPPGIAVAFSTIARQLSVTPQLAASGMKMFVQRLQAAKNIKFFGEGMGEKLQTNFQGTIRKVLSELSKVPRATRGMKVQEIFGSEAAPFILNLMSSQKLMNKTLGVASDKTKTLNSMQKEFVRKSGTTAFMIQQMKSSFTDLSSDIGTTLIPTIKDFVTSLTSVARGAAEWVKANPGLAKFAAIALTIAAALAPVAIVLGTLISLTGPLFGLAAAALAFAAPFILANATIILIGIGIAALISLMIKLGNHFGVIQGIKSFLGFGDDMAVHKGPGAPPVAPSNESSVATKGSKSQVNLGVDLKADGMSITDSVMKDPSSFFGKMNVGMNTAGGG